MYLCESIYIAVSGMQVWVIAKSSTSWGEGGYMY